MPTAQMPESNALIVPRRLGQGRQDRGSSCRLSSAFPNLTLLISQKFPPGRYSEDTLTPPSERKIDEIAANIAEIWQRIQGSSLAIEPGQPPAAASVAAVAEQALVCPFEGESSLTSHSARVGRFMDDTFREDCLHYSSPNSEKVVETLRQICRLQDEHNITRDMFFSDAACRPKAISGMPPLEATVTVLRWAKGKASVFSIFP